MYQTWIELLAKHNIPKPRSGFDIDIGWKQLIDKLFEDLIALGWDRQLFQVKEKFGLLTVYIGGSATPAIFDRISDAEDESGTICEVCGNPGVMRAGGWLKTLCNTHSNGREPYLGAVHLDLQHVDPK